ncbi:MAG: transglycosylase SLT domain-containing protein [Burkholderiaceae bacterium]
MLSILTICVGLSGCASAWAEERDEDAPASEARSASDQAFIAAFRASNRKDLPALEKAALEVPRDHLLIDYIDYWRLRLQLMAVTDSAQQAGADKVEKALDKAPDKAADPEPPLDPALTGAIRGFIKAHGDQVTGDLLRRQWMLELGRRGAWAEFDEHLPDWLRRNDTRVFCYAGLSNIRQGRPVGERAMHAFETDRDLGESCGALAQALLDEQILDKAAMRKRFWRALEVRDWRSASLLATMLGVDPMLAQLSLGSPEQAIAALDAGPDLLPENGRDTLMMALSRLAPPKPMETAARMDELARLLTEPEQRFIWSQIAASAMRDMLPEAYGYTLRAQSAPITDDTREWLVRAALREGDWPLVLRLIGQFSSDGQASATWTYWRARALEATGSRFGAEALYRRIAGRHDFYGELASETIGQPIVAPTDRGTPPSEAEMAAIRALPGMARALKFYELDMRYRGNREWNLAVRQLDDRQLLAAASWACERSLLERCISTAERIRGQHDFALRFISPFREDLAPMANERGLDLAWVYGLIRQESRFTPDAQSSAGARGLMQIMPATGRWIAGRLGVRGFQTRHLFRRDTNLSFGTYYLKTVYEDLRSSPLLASAAYNAGPRRPHFWMSTLKQDVDGALFAEIIPFRETRHYVQKVLLNTAYYGAMFTGQAQSLKELLGTVPAVALTPTAIP